MITEVCFNYYLSPKLSKRQLQKKLESLPCKPASLDRLEFDRPLLIICETQEFKELCERFQYYSDKIFVSFEEVVKEFKTEIVFVFESDESEDFVNFIDFYTFQVERNNRDVFNKVENDIKYVAQLATYFVDTTLGQTKFVDSKYKMDIKNDVDKLTEFLNEIKNIYNYESLDQIVDEYKGLHKFGIKGLKKFFRTNNGGLENMRGSRFVLLPCPSKERSEILQISLENILDPINAFLIICLNVELEKFCLRKKRTRPEQEENSLWEEIFTKIDRPIGIFSESGEVILCNPLFSDLRITPKYCLTLNHGQAIELEHRVYQVAKERIEHGPGHVILMTFEGVGENNGSAGQFTSSELGIITSSLAHELNNPIGGVLAALSLLEIEDNLSSEVLKNISEMKESARRCKNLIEIFLGFSKAYPQERDGADINGALDDALNLLRFRMIETGLRLEFEGYDRQLFFHRKLNRATMAMIFYLVLSEVLTQFSQLLLISSPGEEKVLVVQFRESDQTLTMSLQKKWDIGGKLLNSKLLNHLLDLQGLELEQESRVIRFHSSTLF